MATKKKPKKVTKSKRAANKTSNKKKATSAKRASTKKTPKKSAAKKKLTAKKKSAPNSRKTRGAGGNTQSRPARKNSQRQTALFEQDTMGLRSGGQSGDLQGLSDVEGADSESVDELLEEGNAFEADVVAGVERADDDQTREVRTHEVPEDDVPEEYLDQDKD
jgi:hypothetical protein